MGWLFLNKEKTTGSPVCRRKNTELRNGFTQYVNLLSAQMELMKYLKDYVAGDILKVRHKVVQHWKQLELILDLMFYQTNYSMASDEAFRLC